MKATPKAVKHGAVRLWGVVKGTPTALKIVAQWLWSGLKAVGHGIASIIGCLFSLPHTVFSKSPAVFPELDPQECLEWISCSPSCNVGRGAISCGAGSSSLERYRVKLWWRFLARSD